MRRYDAAEIEPKWQRIWEDEGLYRASDDPADPRPRFYALDMFPYPSGDLHMGHAEAFSGGDMIARYRWMQGNNVLHPIGWDSFGLPAENAAIKRGIHPKEWTYANIDQQRRSFRRMGMSFDWSRQFNTSDPDYYRWTQWLFIRLFERGLAYRKNAPTNWCPKDQTVLANEQVINGACERCGTPVVRKDLTQWFYKTTDYAQRLLDDMDQLDWPERVVTMQRNWIGRSEGAAVEFEIAETGDTVEVFTTRPDTLWGVTFFVFAVEHPLVSKLAEAGGTFDETKKLADELAATPLTNREQADSREGVPLGVHAVNPVNGEKVPVFVAPYVLMEYGTGAVMGVPAHDQRDFEFARAHGLPIRVVVQPPDEPRDPATMTEAYDHEGVMVNSGPFDGVGSPESIEQVTRWLEEQGRGRHAVTYRLRDWLISRQRYWGAPIPIIYCDNCGTVPVPEEDLPVLLPEDAEFMPTGESPLKRDPDFYNTECPRCGGPATRETDTMDTFVDSSWYWYRYLSPHYGEGPWEPEKGEEWLPVDVYTGGIEHAILHLLYARFWTKAMRDLGLVSFGEPFNRLYNQGIILGEDAEKMSKSRGNVVNPQEFVDRYGSDALRSFLMFIGPWDQGGPWDGRGIEGVSRFLRRAFSLPGDGDPSGAEADPAELARRTNRTVKKVTEDLGAFRYNTAIAALMEHTNYLLAIKGEVGEEEWNEALRAFVLVLAPFAPHHAEQMWGALGEAYSVHEQAWPAWDESLIRAEEITLVVQVNGKLRDRIEVPADITEETAKELALSSERVRPHVKGKELRKSVYVPGRLVNLVVG